MDSSTNFKGHPYTNASVASKLIFAWIVPLFLKGWKRGLQMSDIHDVPENDKAGYLFQKLTHYWKNKLSNVKSTPKSTGIISTLIMFWWKSFLITTLFYLLNHCVLAVLQPVVFRELILSLNETPVDQKRACFYAALLSLVVVLQTLTTHLVTFKILTLAMKIRVALSSIIYVKIFDLYGEDLRNADSGFIINLLTNDLLKLDIYLNSVPLVFVAPFQIGVLFYLLYTEIGLAAGLCVFFVLASIPLQSLTGKYAAHYRLQTAEWADQRGSYLAEVISGIEVLKQYAWELPFSMKISEARKLEIKAIKRRGALRAVSDAMITFAPRLVQYFTLLLFAFLGNPAMNTAKYFFVVACIHLLMQTTTHYIPQATTGIGEIYVGLMRVRKFLESSREMSDIFLMDGSANSRLKRKCSGENCDILKQSVVVSLDNVSAAWSGSHRTLVLNNVNFSLNDNKLIMVCGSVGTSKSSFLRAIINDLSILSGHVLVNGSVSYIPQDPWIFAGSVKENIIFGYEFDEYRYNQILNACALKDDLSRLAYGDLSFTGERGSHLSGGQMARVSLARAMYRKCDIYLLDDPFSSLDPKVAKTVFEACIRDYLKDKVRILVTNNFNFLPKADHIVFLEKGRIQSQGKYEEIFEQPNNNKSFVIKRDSVNSLSGSSEGKIHDVADKPELPGESSDKLFRKKILFKTYLEYFLHGKSGLQVLFLILTFLLSQSVASYSDFWLANYASNDDKYDEQANSANKTQTCHDCKTIDKDLYYIYVYTAFAASLTILSLSKSFWFYLFSAKISKNIHAKMVNSLMRSPMQFFYSTPTGSILNRFSRDVGTMDELLPPAFFGTINITLQVFGVLVLVILSNYYLIFLVLVMVVVLYIIRKIFITTAGELKRIELSTKSPILTHISTTLEGLSTIRTSSCEYFWTKKFNDLQDVHSAAWFLFVSANRCFGTWIEIITNAFLFIVTLTFIIFPHSTSTGNAALAISSLLSMLSSLQWGIRQSAETENYMASIDRALEYSKLTPEKDNCSLNCKNSNWLTHGEINFKNVTLKYDSKPVLCDLNFTVLPLEKVGIAGRTGAGKSSIIAALYRLKDFEGVIEIDGVNINTLCLQELRKSISIIPQNPVIFQGSVRFNLDPLHQYDDTTLWNVLNDVKLTHVISNLDHIILYGGSNLSVGERQLLCLARAVLRKSKILLMDEATAKVDPDTESIIQQNIDKNFSTSTIITIAHRLDTISMYDKILLLKNGHVNQYEKPEHVLKLVDIS